MNYGNCITCGKSVEVLNHYTNYGEFKFCDDCGRTLSKSEKYKIIKGKKSKIKKKEELKVEKKEVNIKKEEKETINIGRTSSLNGFGDKTIKRG